MYPWVSSKRPLNVFSKAAICFLFMTPLLIEGSYTSAQTIEYPTKQIDLVVGYSPGGGTDTFFRSIVDALGANIGTKIQIVNKPGGGGTVGAAYVCNARHDGYIILGTPLTTITANPILNPDTPYNLDKFSPIAMCAYEPGVFVVRKDSGINTFDQLIARIQKEQGSIKAGTGGVGTEVHLSLELLKSVAKIDIPHMPFGGGAESIAAILGNHVQLIVSSASIIKSHLETGKLVALAVTSPQRAANLPEVPTTAELGFPAVNITNGKAIVGPANLPSQIVSKLEKGIQKTLLDSQVKAKLGKLDYVTDFQDSTTFKKSLERETAMYKKLFSK